MQRVRVGVTGLAAVGIVVAVATAIASGLPQPVGNASIALTNQTVMANTLDGDAEPLAQLGAAPGGVTEQPASKR